MAKKKLGAEKAKSKKEYGVYSPAGELIRTYQDKKLAEGFASKAPGRVVK